MTINATIIIQIINFILGYFLISKFLLKPVYDTLKQEDHYKQNLGSKLHHEADKVIGKEETKRKHWLACQSYFNEHKPQLHADEYQENNKNLSIQTKDIDSKKIEEIEQKIIQKLKTKILQN